MKPYDRFQEGVHTKERENLSLVQRRGRGSKRVYSEVDKKGIYLTVKVTTNCISFFVGNKDGKKRMVQDYQYLNE